MEEAVCERTDLLRACLSDPKKKVKIGHSARIFCCRAHVFPKEEKEKEPCSDQQETRPTKRERLRNWCDRLFLATCGEDKTVRIWWSSKLKLLHTLLGHQEEVLSVEWSKQGTILASCAADNMVHLWKIDLATIHDTAPTIMAKLRHEDHVYRAVFANKGPFGSAWPLGGEEGTSREETKTETDRLEREREREQEVTLGCKLVTCSNNQVFCWDSSSEDCLLVKTCDRKGIRYGGERNTQALAFIFDMAIDARNRVAIALSDGTVRILTFSKNEEREQVLGKLDSPVTCLRWMIENHSKDFTPHQNTQEQEQEEETNEGLLCVCCADGTIHLIDTVQSLRKKQFVSRRSWQAHHATIFGCIPVGKDTVLSCSGDQSVKLWDCSKLTHTDSGFAPKVVAAMSEPDYPFHSVDFATDGEGSLMLFTVGGKSGILGTPFFYRTIFDI